MSSMFKGCSSLESLEIKNFDVKNVNYMNEMFSGAIKLKSLDLSSFETTNLVSCTDIWKDIPSLTIKINQDKNKKLLENKPESVVIEGL